jgi:thiol-disulfide isomerase/thioredoxin
LRRFLAISVVALAVRTAHAGQATCSNPGLPVGAAASGDLLPGRLTLALTTGLLVIDGSEVVIENAGRIRNDSRLSLFETRLSASYALTSSIAFGAALPYRVVDVGVDYFDPATGAPLPNGSSIHIRDERLTGFGDPSLHVHGAREVGAWRFHARLGTTLPVASTVENPHLLGGIGQEHQHVQLGTGTVIPFGVVEAQRRFGDGARTITAAAFTAAFVSLYENDEGFKAGHRISGGLSASSSFGLSAFSFGVAAEVHGETAETWDGIEYADEGNNGRIDTLVGGSIAYRPIPQLAIAIDAKFPVYSKVYGTQLDYGPVFGLGVVGTFETRAKPSYRGADLGIVGPPGSASPLVPVPNKITVFDLWADWCAPCRELDERLADLAKRYPDRIAIRKLDVVDSDSAAWAKYIAPGGFDMPHVKVHGKDGTLVFERSAPPLELVRAIEALLR